MRVGLLSTARINGAIVRGAALADGVAITAVASRDAERAHAHAQEQGLGEDVRVHGSYEDLLADDEVDVVYNPLPNSMHVDWSIRALVAGKHVLCEKPLSRRPDDVERAFDAAERAGRVLAEAFMWRHHPQARALLEALPRVGAVRSLRSSFSFPLDREGDVRLSAELDGGALMDVGCYCVSAARLVLGEPVSVTAQSVGEEVDLRMVATLLFPGGATAHFDCAMDLALRHELEVAGDRGVLRLPDPFHGKRAAIEVHGPDGTVEGVEIEQADPYACELLDLKAAVDGIAPHPYGREDAVAQARVIAALYEAAGTGRTVALS